MPRRELPPFPLPVALGALLVAVGLTTFLVMTLRRDQAEDETAADRAFQSALLPDDWKTYGTDFWSVGYPSDWVVERMDEGLEFVPPSYRDEREKMGSTYFALREDDRTVEVIEAAYAQTAMVKSRFLFAGYPTIKYTDGSRQELYVSYEDRILRIVTDYPNDPEIGIMLATFKFLY